MKKILLLSAALSLALPSAASAAVTLTSEPGKPVYDGPTPTFDFEVPTPEFTGGTIKNENDGNGARPFGGTGKYASVGPGPGTPGYLNLAAFGDIDFISFIWGSIDAYNTLDVLGAGDAILGSFTGTSVIAAANGDQSSPATNRLVKLTFTDADRSNVLRLRFTSSGNAFETDKFTVAVPEPTTWMLMLMGMAGIGFTMRRKRNTTLRVRFA
ncbi:PEP-CTERM sorting domain-containing protein [Sphingorhabdus sp.]|uniref:Npun_F0296 family exosortase-dependent surface protein n=1 Tax=Sphingorhabdus sp. TaxID=1902408 RepID=UPI0039835E5A